MPTRKRDVLDEKVAAYAANPRAALWTLAFPITAGMFVQIIYNLTDTAFIGRLGVDALAAASFSFPLFFLFIAFSNMISNGAIPLIARAIGARRKEEAELIAGHAFTLSLLLGALFMAVGLFFGETLFRLMGATEPVVKLGVQYMLPLFLSSVFFFLSSAFSAILIAQGETKLPVAVRIVSVLLNLVMDYLFIFVFRWGILGASIATALSIIFEVVAFTHLIFLRGRTHLKFRARRPDATSTWSILKIGIPSSLAHVLMSVSGIIYNAFFAAFGTGVVAAYGLVGRVDSIAFMPVLGLTVAMVTLISMFYGAKHYHLLKTVISDGLLFSFLYLIPFCIIVYAFPHLFIRLMTDDASVLALAIPLMRLEVFTLPLAILGFILSRALQGVGDGVAQLVIVSVRLIVIAVPLAFLFTRVLGYGAGSIIVAMLLSGIVSAAMAVVWTRWRLKKVKAECLNC